MVIGAEQYVPLIDGNLSKHGQPRQENNGIWYSGLNNMPLVNA